MIIPFALETELLELTSFQEEVEVIKEKIYCEVDKIVKKHYNEQYRIDFTTNMLLIRFKTKRLDPEVSYLINKELGSDGALVSKNSIYGFQLVYMAYTEEL
jgi:hypothetical protein